MSHVSNDPQFRLAVESDADILLPFMGEYYAFDRHGFDEGKARVALTTLLRDASLGRAWLILDVDAAVGYVVLCFGYSLEWLGRDAFVDEFYLREEYRGRGWGRATMEFVEEAARAAGIRALHLEVVRENPRRSICIAGWDSASITARSCRNGSRGISPKPKAGTGTEAAEK